MLTNLHYYNHYKPYIVGEDDAADESFRYEKIAVRRQNAALAAENDSAPVFALNAALNGKVLRYLRSTAKTVVDIKYYASIIDVDMRIFIVNVPIYGLSPFKQSLCRSLETFAICYDRAVNSLAIQAHSPQLRDFSEDLAYMVEDNIDDLSELGFGFDSKGELFFDTDYYNESSKNEIMTAIKNSSDIFYSIYEIAGNILEIPMAAHMNFRGFDYYYSYRATRRIEDTFRIIESGMLLDKAL
ncbi:MAG: hypothetical protein FWE29_00665 [Defluviitaleaceae bacterium]|nr:hypothetical protein [Defluviitaleaceae bacterium]